MNSLHSSYYIQDSIFEKEKKHIFLKEWIPVAHKREFPAPISVIERTLLDFSILLIQEHDEIRAFHNICPHRAGPLLWPEECTAIKALRCRYHGWRFDLQGTRTHSPDFGASLEGHNLTPIATKEHNGLIFVCLQSPSCDLDASLHHHIPDLSQFQFHSHARHEINCNWKTYVENYLEGYHIPYLHPSLRSSITLSQYKIEIHGDIITHSVPSDPTSPSVGFWAYLWPNTAINVYGSGMSIERILPIDTHHTQIHYIYLFASDLPQEECERSIAMSREVTQEDIRICNILAQNLRTGRYKGGPLSQKHEHGVAYVQQRILKAIT